MSKWKRINTRVLLRHPRLTLVEDEVLLPDGQKATYLRYDEYKDYPTIIAQNDHDQYLLIHEYAYPSDQILLQFPEGSQEFTETILEAAARELHEEAAYTADTFSVIGTNLAYHRRTDALNHVVLAKGNLRPVVEIAGDSEEQGIVVVWLSENEIWEAISEGKIIQKNTLAAWAILQAQKKSIT